MELFKYTWNLKNRQEMHSFLKIYLEFSLFQLSLTEKLKFKKYKSWKKKDQIE